MKLLVGALVLATSAALDAKLQDVVCEEGLPLSIASDGNFKIVCPDSGTDAERCSFRGDTATLSGNFAYNGLENAGLTDSTAYFTAKLKFVSLEYLLFSNQQIDLCNEDYITPQNANDGGSCLADGTYGFQIPYTLPDYEDNASWLATGWSGKGYMKMYKDDSDADESLIGSCTFKLTAMVTENTDGSFTPPTAAMTAGILAGMAALGSLLWCYCACCRRSPQKVVVVEESSLAGTKKGKDTSNKKTEDDATKRDSGTAYTKMEDDGTLDSTKLSSGLSVPSNKNTEVGSKAGTKRTKIFKFLSPKKKKVDGTSASDVV